MTDDLNQTGISHFVESDSSVTTQSTGDIVSEVKIERLVVGEKADSSAWVMFANSFVELAEVGLNCYYASISEGNSNGNKELLLSIIFNVKHSLELLIKAIYRASGRNFDYVHDITGLYNLIIDKKSDFAELIPGVLVDNDLVNLRTMVFKYSSLAFVLPPYLQLWDTKNDIFRYPEPKLDNGGNLQDESDPQQRSNKKQKIPITYTVHHKELIDSLSDDNIESIRSDIPILKSLIGTLNKTSIPAIETEISA